MKYLINNNKDNEIENQDNIISKQYSNNNIFIYLQTSPIDKIPLNSLSIKYNFKINSIPFNPITHDIFYNAIAVIEKINLQDLKNPTKTLITK